MEEDNPNMRFTTENDYEDGEWIEGEFFYKNEVKRRKVQTKDDIIYGVFNPAEDTREQPMNVLKPMNFVASGTVNLSEEAKEEEKAPAPARGGIGFSATSSSGRGGLGFSAASSSSGGGLGFVASKGGLGFTAASGDSNELDVDEEEKELLEIKKQEKIKEKKFKSYLKGVEPTSSDDENNDEDSNDDKDKREEKPERDLRAEKGRRLAQLKVDKKSLGKFEKHTKGFASRYLEKFNFEGRLGKHGTGISAPIAVKVRPNRLGMGYGNFQEANTLEANKLVEAEQFDEVIENSAILKKESEKLKQKEEIDRLWKLANGNKKVNKRQKKKYVTSHELISQKEKDSKQAISSSNSTILDMRSAVPKVLTDMTDVSQPVVHDATKQEQRVVGKELMYNIKYLLELNEMNILTLDRKIYAENENKKNLQKTVDELTTVINDGKQINSRLDKVITMVEMETNKIDSLLDDTAKLDSLYMLIKDLNDSYRVEYFRYNLYNIIPSILIPSLTNVLKQMDLFDVDTVDSELVPMILKWKQYTQFENSNELFDHMIHQSILPILQLQIGRHWQVYSQPDSCIYLLSSLEKCIENKAVILEVQTATVIPCLRRAVNGFELSKHPAMHMWLLQWLPILESKFKALLPIIKQKLSEVCVASFDIHSDVVLDMLLPWKKVFSKSDFSKLIANAVMPKLVVAMKNDFQLDPSQQDLTVYHQMLQWYDTVVPERYFVALLQGEFFPKFLSVLTLWLNSEQVDLKEIVSWYEGWKQLIPESLRRNLRITSCFDTALQLMNQKLNKPKQPVKLAFRFNSYKQALAAIEAAPSTAATSDEPVKKRAVSAEVSFKDVVESYLETASLTFMPAQNHSLHQGKKVYVVNKKLNVVLSNDVIYVQPPKEQRKLLSDWQPISLEELAKKAR